MIRHHTSAYRLRHILTYGMILVIFCVYVLLLVGCEGLHNPEDYTNTTHTTQNPLHQGQLNALNSYISKRWQLVSINHIAPTHGTTLDLSDFSHRKGRMLSDCGVVEFWLNTDKVIYGGLSVTYIERQFDTCPHDDEDILMEILGDLHSFEKQGDSLILISLQDKLELRPLD